MPVFTLEILEEIRKQVGSDYILGVRMVFDEDVPDGLQLNEGMKICEMMVQSGTLDFITVIKGYIDTPEGLSHIIPATWGSWIKKP